MNATVKLLTAEEREQIERRLLRMGSEASERSPNAALYLAEKARERRDDVEAYAYLLKAVRLGAAGVPAATVNEYQAAAERTPKEVLRENSYTGCLLLAKELFALDDEDDRGLYYLAFAANSDQDKFGVAARLMADHLVGNHKYMKQQLYYEKRAAAAGNPDLLPIFSKCSSGNAYRE